MIERRTFRLGVVVLAVAAMNLAIAVMMPREAGVLPWLLVGAACAIGIGLLVRARVARALAGLVFLVCAVAMPVSLIGSLAEGLPPDDWNLPVLLSMANAVVTTALGVWLCVRAIQVLLGRPWRASLATARLAGGTLAVVAANHLWFAAAVGPGFGLGWFDLGSSSLSISISPRGIELTGFSGWPIWHLVLAVIALAMLVAPRRIVERVATLLVLWFACLVPFALIDALRPRDGGFGLFLVLVALVPVYLAWWLRDELHRSEPRAETSTS